MALYDPGEQRMIRWGPSGAGLASLPDPCHRLSLVPVTPLHAASPSLVPPVWGSLCPFVPGCPARIPRLPIIPSPAVCPAQRELVYLTEGKEGCPFQPDCLLWSRGIYQQCARCAAASRGTAVLGAVHAQRAVACCRCAVVCCPVLICPRPHGRQEPAQPTPEPGYHWHSMPPCKGPASRCAWSSCKQLLGVARLGQSACCDWGHWSDKGSVWWQLSWTGHTNGGPSSALPVAEGLQPTSLCFLVGGLLVAPAWPALHCAGTHRAPALLSWCLSLAAGSSLPCLPLAARIM